MARQWELQHTLLLYFCIGCIAAAAAPDVSGAYSTQPDSPQQVLVARSGHLSAHGQLGLVSTGREGSVTARKLHTAGKGAVSRAFHRCGSVDPTPEKAQQVREQLAQHAAAVMGTDGAASARVVQRLIKIDVHFHIIRASRKVSQGSIPQPQVEAQMQVLNRAFAPAGFTFNLVSHLHINQPAWFTLVRGGSTQIAAKRALHVGDHSTLNIYTGNVFNETKYPLLGFTTFPWDVNDSPANLLYDGVVAQFNTLPGGANMDGYNKGNTIVHEVGHWLGLYHPFQNNCIYPGDEVNDTPYEAYDDVLSYECIERDTCPLRPGLDPIHNFMGYSPDSCMRGFTPLQGVRMRMMWGLYRAPSPSPSHKTKTTKKKATKKTARKTTKHKATKKKTTKHKSAKKTTKPKGKTTKRKVKKTTKKTVKKTTHPKTMLKTSTARAKPPPSRHPPAPHTHPPPPPRRPPPPKPQAQHAPPMG